MKLYEASTGVYLLLVSFSTLSAIDFSHKVQDTPLYKSPYNGIAIPYVNAYHHNDVSHREINASLRKISSSSGKQIWPWVFLNRIVGYDLKTGKEVKKKSAFSSIKGMDIRNENGDLSEFYNIVDGALKYANKNNTGIVIDLEPYNDHSLYSLPLLANKTALSKVEVSTRLKNIGAQIIIKTHNINPKMKIWLLFTGLDQKKFFKEHNKWETRSVTYLVQGMLEEIINLKSDIELISGGELSIGYCLKNLQHLKKRINKRYNRNKTNLEKNPNLSLGAPIVPWENKNNVKGWLNKGICKKSSLKSPYEFNLIWKELKENYKYIWTYSTGHSDYNPFSGKNNHIENTIFSGPYREQKKL